MSDSKAPLEKELKYLLTKNDYEKLLRASRGKIIKSVKQVNVYFDDNSLLLHRKRIGLRIRIENGKDCTLTVKEPSKIRPSKISSFKVRHEWESNLPVSVAKKLIKGKTPLGSLKKKPIQVLKKYFSKSELEGISPLGAATTFRTLVQSEKKVLLEVDKFKMFDQSFYELEVETSKPLVADKVVRTLLKKENIPCRPITKSKLGRFLDLWKKKRRR